MEQSGRKRSGMLAFHQTAGQHQRRIRQLPPLAAKRSRSVDLVVDLLT